MITKVKKLLKRHSAPTLKELSNKLEISPNVIKNISSERTDFSSLFKRRIQHRAHPKNSKKLAELMGIILGDGNIFAFERCQRLTISCNSSYDIYTQHVKNLVRDVFGKEPTVKKRSNAKCHDVCLYMQDHCCPN